MATSKPKNACVPDRTHPSVPQRRHYDELIRRLALADAPFYVDEAKQAGGPANGAFVAYFGAATGIMACS